MWDYIYFLIISLFIIMCSDYLYKYLLDNYTRKSEKDVLHNQTQKYKKIIEDLTNQEKQQELLDFALDESKN